MDGDRKGCYVSKSIRLKPRGPEEMAWWGPGGRSVWLRGREGGVVQGKEAGVRGPRGLG